LPPRKSFDIAHRPLARDLYRDFLTTKARITELAELGLDAGLAAIEAERQHHVDFAQRQWAFLHDELVAHAARNDPQAPREDDE
jgi:hypothetical protein